MSQTSRLKVLGQLREELAHYDATHPQLQFDFARRVLVRAVETLERTVRVCGTSADVRDLDSSRERLTDES